MSWQARIVPAPKNAETVKKISQYLGVRNFKSPGNFIEPISFDEDLETQECWCLPVPSRLTKQIEREGILETNALVDGISYKVTIETY